MPVARSARHLRAGLVRTIRKRQCVRMVVVAIGGSASVGKTTLSAALDFERVVHVDDLRGPSFIDTTPNVWRRPAMWLRDSLIAETAAGHHAIATEIEAMLVAGADGVIEGEGVEPRLCRRWPSTIVRPVYVIEDDADILHATFARRSSGARFLSLRRAEQTAVVEMNRLYGAWLRDEAEASGQAWIPSRPWASLAGRLRSVTRAAAG